MTADDTRKNATDAAVERSDAAAKKADAAVESVAEKTDVAADAEALQADEPAAKPKRDRAVRPKAEKAAPAAEAPAAAAKPKRRRAAKPKAAEAEAAAGPAEEVVEAKSEEAAAAAAAPAKPRRGSKAAAPVAPARAERPPKPARAKTEPHEPRRGAAGKATVFDAAGKELESRDLRPELFAVPADVGVMHLAVRGEQLARRRGTASTKTRGEISGSTAKLFRQKGTGRARAGSIKSPVRTGGGTAFGPKPRSYAIKVNRKVVKKALAMALSNRAENGNVFVASGLELESPSTKRVHDFLVGLDIAAPVLVVTDDEPVVTKSVRNLSYAETVEVRGLSTERVLRTRSLLLTEKAFAALSEA